MKMPVTIKADIINTLGGLFKNNIEAKTKHFSCNR